MPKIDAFEKELPTGDVLLHLQRANAISNELMRMYTRINDAHSSMLSHMIDH